MWELYLTAIRNNLLKPTAVISSDKGPCLYKRVRNLGLGYGLNPFQKRFPGLKTTQKSPLQTEHIPVYHSGNPLPSPPLSSHSRRDTALTLMHQLCPNKQQSWFEEQHGSHLGKSRHMDLTPFLSTYYDTNIISCLLVLLGFCINTTQGWNAARSQSNL